MEWIKITLCATFLFNSFLLYMPPAGSPNQSCLCAHWEHLETCTSPLDSCTLVRFIYEVKLSILKKSLNYLEI